MKSFRLYICFALLVATSAVPAFAQDNGLPPGLTAGDLENDILNQVENAGGAADTGTTTGTNNSDPGSEVQIPDLVFEEIDIPVNQDQRSQRGFVGVSREAPDSILPEYRFVGANSDSLTGTTASGGSLAARRSNAGGGANGNTNGFNVNRITPIRSRVVRSFRAPTVAPTNIATRVNRRFTNLPATSQFSNSMNVTMRGRTAIISGTAQSQTQINRIRRQLRLEPGVSQIESRVALTGF